jgi:hypothetical protein
MNSVKSNDLKKEKICCSFCRIKIKAKEEHNHNSKVLCENCCIDIRSPRVRKTHWQYLISIKTGYLIPVNREKYAKPYKRPAG